MAIEDFFLAHARVSTKDHKKVTLEDKMTFFRQLSTLAAAGSPLLQAIQIAAQQSESIRLRKVLEDVGDRVSAGSTLCAALAPYRDIFEEHWIELIGIGEVSGKMDDVLADLNVQIADSRETRKKVKGAMTYPIVLLIVALLVITAMLGFVVPTFVKMFEDMDAELPDITKFVLAASNFVTAYAVYIIISVVVVVVSFLQYMKTERGRLRVHAIAMAVPAVGPLMVQAAMYRFTSNLALLVKSGIPILQTLDSLVAVFGASPIYRDAIAHVRKRVSAGQPLADALERTGLFTSMVTGMVRIGEESSDLYGVMSQLAPFYKERMQGFITRLTKLMEPCIIMIMGVTIAGLMLAIYMPMFEMAGAVH